jgi:hypothetical protein
MTALPESSLQLESLDGSDDDVAGAVIDHHECRGGDLKRHVEEVLRRGWSRPATTVAAVASIGR